MISAVKIYIKNYAPLMAKTVLKKILRIKLRMTTIALHVKNKFIINKKNHKPIIRILLDSHER